MVEVGFTPPEVTKRLPSTMNKFFTSCDRPHGFTTERAGSAPMRAVPRRGQPPYRMGLLTQMSVAFAAALGCRGCPSAPGRVSRGYALPAGPRRTRTARGDDH